MLMETWLIILIVVLVIAAVCGLALVYFLTQRKEEVEAVEVGRRQYGNDLTPFDGELEGVLERRTMNCPNCGDVVGPYDEECPACNTRLKAGEYECGNCHTAVDPRENVCPNCGDILLAEPYVCPKCDYPVEADSRKCDNCGATYWSPILLDRKSIKARMRPVEAQVEEKPKEVPPKSERTAYRRVR